MDNNLDFLLQQISRGKASDEQMAQAEAQLAQMEKRMERMIDGWNTVERTTNRHARKISLRWIAGVAASWLLIVSLSLIATHHNSSTQLPGEKVIVGRQMTGNPFLSSQIERRTLLSHSM